MCTEAGRERGATLVEALVALAILGVALTGILPSFITQLQSNTRSEERTSAVVAAQLVMDFHRLEDPEAMPTTGTSAPQLVTIGGLEYEVTTRYCVEPAFCGDESRHLVVEVHRLGRKIFDVETVYTQLR
jgi:type II secretory pathway pseudopilin PulG